MSKYSIKDLEQLSGIKAHTLRIWEQRFNFINPLRTDTNIRFYTDQDLKLVLNISLLKDHGYKISDIAKMKLNQLADEVVSISEKHHNYPDQIQSLTIAMIDMNEDSFDSIMNDNIEKFGFENTMLHIIYPFLIKIGTLWVTGSIGPSQEHFITSLIRQKMIVAIHNLPKTLKENHKTFILYTPEGEYHEVGILFAYYILKSRQHKVLYFGQSLPFEDLKFVVNRQKVDAIFTAITSLPSHKDVQNYVEKVASNFMNQTIYFTGMQIVGQGLDLKPNAQIVNKINDLMELADN